jgi:hypothetical protein
MPSIFVQVSEDIPFSPYPLIPSQGASQSSMPRKRGGYFWPVLRIPDPGSGAYLTHGSGNRNPGLEKNQGSGSGIRIRDEQAGSNFQEP